MRRLLLWPAAGLCFVLIAAVVAIAFGASLPFLGGNDANLEDAAAVGAEVSSVSGSVPASQYGLPARNSSDPRRAFLLMGYGGGGHEGAYLSDSMMLVIEDPVQKTLAMLSLPRDIWAPLMFDGKTAVFNKLNTAYAFAKDSSLYKNRLPRYTGTNAAGRFSLDTIARLTGVPITNYAALDFEGFRQMIDAVGGVDVEVPATFSARYPANDNPAIDPSWIVISFNKGKERMGGERAIRFARAREAITNVSEGSDFARSRRQRLIMEAFKNKLLTPGGLLQVPQLLGITAKHVDTDYVVPDALQLGQLALSMKDYHIFQTALTTSNYLDESTGPGGAYILVPATADRSWDQVRAFVQRLWQDPAAGVAMANTKVTVVNDTGVSGLAGHVSDVLRKMGYRVNSPETGQLTGVSRVVDRTGGKALALAQQLGRDLGVTVETVAGDPSPEGDEVELHVGSDNLALADLKAPDDVAAPVSAVGVATPTRSGGAPSGAAPTVKPALPSPTTTASATPSATRGADATTPSPTKGSVVSTATAVSAPNTPAATPRATLPSTVTPTLTPAAATRTATPVPTPATATPTQRPTTVVPATPTPKPAASVTATPAVLGTPMTP
ncbi:MAG: LCP family protein [Chloroflexota bacterium]